MKLSLIVSWALLCAGLPLAAQEAAPGQEFEVIVTATRTPVPARDVANAVTVITGQQMKERGIRTVFEALRDVPGVNVSQSGSAGRVTSVSIRGANPSQTLVLIDGVEVNSPTSGPYDFAHLNVDNIDRIEVVRGPQSTLYGSEAMGGVIQIFTRAGTAPRKVFHESRIGSEDTWHRSFHVTTGPRKEGIPYSASLSWDDTDGFYTNDDYRNLTFSGRIDAPIGSTGHLALTGRIVDTDGGVPGQVPFGIDPDQTQETFDGLLSARFEHEDGNRRDVIGLSAYKNRLTLSDDPLGEPFPVSGHAFSSIEGQLVTFDWQSDFHSGSSHTLTPGFEVQWSQGVNDSHDFFGTTQFDEGTTNRAYLLQHQYRSPGGRFNWVGGIRYEDNNQFGSDFNGRAAVAYAFPAPDLKLKGSWGTGFRAPSINDLFFPGYGNPSLEPEESEGWDVGLEKHFGSAWVEAAYFRNDFDNLIAAVPTDDPSYPFGVKAGNVDKATTEGFEFGGFFPLGRSWRVNAAYTRLETSTTGQPLLRRPNWKGNVTLNYRSSRWNVNLHNLFVGDRMDNDFQGPPYGTGRGLGKYDGYTRVDLDFVWYARKNWELFGHAQNLFDEEYEEAAGYPAAERSFWVGWRRYR